MVEGSSWWCRSQKCPRQKPFSCVRLSEHVPAADFGNVALRNTFRCCFREKYLKRGPASLSPEISRRPRPFLVSFIRFSPLEYSQPFPTLVWKGSKMGVRSRAGGCECKSHEAEFPGSQICPIGYRRARERSKNPTGVKFDPLNVQLLVVSSRCQIRGDDFSRPRTSDYSRAFFLILSVVAESY